MYVYFKVWDEITYQFPNFNGWKSILSVKGALGIQPNHSQVRGILLLLLLLLLLLSLSLLLLSLLLWLLLSLLLSLLLLLLFNFNSISPGSSHPSIQRGARPLTGDLPTTAPSPMPFEFWKLFPTLMYCLWLYLPLNCWVLAQHLWNIKISVSY